MRCVRVSCVSLSSTAKCSIKTAALGVSSSGFVADSAQKIRLKIESLRHCVQDSMQQGTGGSKRGGSDERDRVRLVWGCCVNRTERSALTAWRDRGCGARRSQLYDVYR